MADSFYSELEKLGNDWVSFYEIINDLDINDISGDDILYDSLDKYSTILADTFLFIDEYVKEPIADADLSGFLEALEMDIDFLFELNDEEEMLVVLKDMARLVINLCEYCGILLENSLDTI